MIVTFLIDKYEAQGKIVMQRAFNFWHSILSMDIWMLEDERPFLLSMAWSFSLLFTLLISSKKKFSFWTALWALCKIAWSECVL